MRRRGSRPFEHRQGVGRFLGFWSVLLSAGLGMTVAADAPPPPPIPRPTVDADSPRLEIPKPVVDLGTVMEGGDVQAVFEIENRGKSDLKILRAQPSCGCTVVQNDETIPAGGKGKLTATYHTQGRPGPATKSITVDTNDPMHAQVALSFTVTVVQPIEIHPSPWITLVGVEGDKLKNKWTLHRQDGKPLELTEMTNTVAGVGLTLSRVTEADADPADVPGGARPGDWRIEARLEDTSVSRSVTGSVSFKTNHPDRPHLEIPVNVQVNPVLQVIPNQLTLYSDPSGGGQPVTTVVDLRNSGYHVFRVGEARIEGNLPHVTATLITQERMMVQRVQVKFDPAGVAAGVYEGRLLLSTDLAVKPTVEVPVRLQVQAPAAAH